MPVAAVRVRETTEPDAGSRLLVATRSLSFHLAPRPVNRPWGGARVARRFGWETSATPPPIGEWWLASCHPGTVTALRGGDSDLSRWLDGPGHALGLASVDFPVLTKFLDCAELLSLQVHPSDEVARRQGLPRGKTEAWYVLEAEPGAVVYLGTAAGVHPHELLDRVAAGASDDEVRGMLRAIEVSAGDTLLVEAGTVHAIGGGLALFEVQQNSDTTWRIHDWGRGREVHVDRARASVVDHAPVQPIRMTVPTDRWVPLLQGPAFDLWQAHPRQLAYAPRNDLGLLTVLAGQGELQFDDETLTLLAGDTVVVVGNTTLTGEDLDVLAVELPR